jgi:DNA mismatch endonuclease (patch repair protein)
MSTKSEQMAGVRSRDTEPELQMRRLLTERGVRYRLHRKDLPGRPDVYIPRLRIALFINGCFWHGHDCPRGRRPVTNVEFWNAKISRNVARDAAATTALRMRGIDSETLWTCSTQEFGRVADKLARRYRSPS